MRRIVLGGIVVLAAVAVVAVLVVAATSGSSAPTYKIQFDNAFGLVNGAQLKVAGVPAGTIKSISLPAACEKGDPTACYSVVTVEVTEHGYGAFRSDAFCQSRPQSLIGEYFIDCQPGQYGKPLASGSTIPVTHTQSTIPADLLLDVMRMPTRQRVSLIVGELGAAAAGRSGDLQAALQRAVPALTETDNLLHLLANDSRTLQQLTVSADAVVTALARNSAGVQHFVTAANNTASAVATQDANLRATLAQLPGFLEQLRPAMAQLGVAAGVYEPVLANLNRSAAQLDRLLTDLPPFSRSALPAIRSLGQASVAGKAAVQAAGPTVKLLGQFARPTPELAQNLAIVLHDLDNRSRAVEPDSRSPGGRGYTGLEALLQYVFNQTLSINTFGPLGHLLAVDAFVDPMCSPYATPATIAMSLKQYGAKYRNCYAWLGPNQPGVNETDPSNPGACVPDPGGAPPGQRGPKTSARKCPVPTLAAAANSDVRSAGGAARTASGGTATATSRAPWGGGTAAAAPPAASPPNLPAASTTAPQAAGGRQTQQLLNYLLDP